MTISNLMKMGESSQNGKKTLWEKEKLLVTSNFSFSHSVFKRPVLQTRKNQGLFGKGLNPTNNHPERIDKKLKIKENTLNMEGIEYTVSLKNIDKFEKQNQSICIIVFGYDWKSVYPLRNSNNVDREHKIRLMLIEENGVNHYCLIKNISALLSSQISKHKCKTYFCDRCLNPSNCEESLNKHLEYCGKHKAVKIKMPSKGSILKLYQKISKTSNIWFFLFYQIKDISGMVRKGC